MVKCLNLQNKTFRRGNQLYYIKYSITCQKLGNKAPFEGESMMFKDIVHHSCRNKTIRFRHLHQDDVWRYPREEWPRALVSSYA